MTPRDHGYRVPPDWAPQRRSWLAWPGRGSAWNGHAAAARAATAELARTIDEFAPVTVLANPEELVEVSLACGQGIRAIVLPHGDCRLRAIGPTFLARDDQAAGIAWRAGEPDDDTHVAKCLLERLELPAFIGPLPLAGGAIDVDGDGTCLAATSLLARSGLRADEVETVLAEFLGIEKVIWLESGLAGERAGGVIANVARFLAPGLVLAMVAGDRRDDDTMLLESNLERLRAASDARCRRLDLVPVPRPRPRRRPDGTPLPLSYTNCLLAGGTVIMPAFEESRDQTAHDGVAAALPGVAMLSFPALDLAYGGDGLGSLVLSQPA